ncbi:hypothetical protein MBLNU457_1834t1 [Dothideomycetes sp. NU457]
MTSSGQRSTRNHAHSISNEAALVGALTAFAKSPSTSPNAPRNSQANRGTGRRAVSTGNYATRSFSQTSIQNGFADTVRISAHGLPPQNKISDNSQTKTLPKTGPKAVLSNATVARETPAVVRPAPKLIQTKEKVVAGDVVRDVVKPDETRIPSTSALVQMFEKKETMPEPVRPTTESETPRPTSRLRSRSLLTVGITKQTTPEAIQPPVADQQIPAVKVEPISSPESFVSATDSLTPEITTQSTDLMRKPDLPMPRRRKFDRSVSPRANIAAESTESLPLHSLAIPNRRGSGQDGPYSNHWAASSTQSITAQYHQLHPRRMSALRTGDSLANALVASSLASSRSSRAASPARPQPIPHRNSRSSFHSHHLFQVRTPSPAKKPRILKQTLRKDDSSSSDTDSEDPYGKHKKKRHIRKHPNKHHEGDRKRWRNAVTERERKRFEGVWAANRGIACVYTAEEEAKLAASYTSNDEKSATAVRDAIADQVSDVVVRDLWQRSRLPQHVLQEIWDLVDGSRTRRLSREEFVVGLWLVDQRLKGRKLPMRVSESVWNSVRFIQGIKIRKA